MTRQVMVNRTMAVLQAFFFLMFLIAALALYAVKSWVGGTLFLAMAFLYLLLAAMYSAVVRIDAEGISRKVWFLPPESYSWKEVQEVGVFGSKALKQRNSKKVGTLYFYFSTQRMTEDERFAMILKWPTRKIHFLFDRRSLEIIQYYWDREIDTCNIGDLKL